jgi:uncharacterized membrane protein
MTGAVGRFEGVSGDSGCLTRARWTHPLAPSVLRTCGTLRAARTTHMPHTFHRISVRVHRADSRITRSLVKTLTYRLLLACLDFLVIYLFTRQLELALGFTVVSRLYTVAAYFFHERAWDFVTWGVQPAASRET